MEYPKIVSIEVENFMVYSHAILNFDDTNIINLKGYNSAGKSTLLKAVAVCLMNMYPKAQTKFIRHGEQYFRIAVSFEDGVVIRKDKYINGKTLYEVYKNGKCVHSTKEGNSLTKVSEVPQSIQDYLGLCFVSLGCLNYQIRQDPLWLIETTGSKNYASLNEILKSDELAKANAMLNTDVNKLSSEITGIEAALQETRLSLVEARGYTEELLDNLEIREKICKSMTARYKVLKVIYDLVNEIAGIKVYPLVEGIDNSRLSEIDDIKRVCEGLSVPEIPVIDVIDYTSYASVSALRNTCSQLEGMGSEYPEVETIGINYKILDLVRLISQLKEADKVASSISAEDAKVRAQLDVAVSKAAEQGIKYVKCGNCGSYVEVHS